MLPDARPVTCLTEDSVHLRGSYWEARDENAISLLLIHDAGEDRSVWDPFVPLFRSRGWGVLAVDLRGHGESVRQDMRPDLLKPNAEDLISPHQYPTDMRAALAFMARQPKAVPAKLATIGVGLGADLVYASSGRGWGNASGVCIGLDDQRGRLLAGAGAFAPRSIYLVYGADDTRSAQAAGAFAAVAQYPAETFAYPNTSSTGITLYHERSPEIVARSIAWIARTI
jgi:pimeloyl-ACP methyl ester carboxylesterase